MNDSRLLLQEFHTLLTEYAEKWSMTTEMYRKSLIRRIEAELASHEYVPNGWRKVTTDMKARPHTGYVLDRATKHIIVFDGNQPWEYDLPPLPESNISPSESK